jgi:hypothetical protein
MRQNAKPTRECVRAFLMDNEACWFLEKCIEARSKDSDGFEVDGAGCCEYRGRDGLRYECDGGRSLLVYWKPGLAVYVHWRLECVVADDNGDALVHHEAKLDRKVLEAEDLV